MKTKNRFKRILYLYFLLMISSKLAVFTITLLEFLIVNYIIFDFKFQMIPQLLLIHLVLYIFVFGKFQNEMFITRQKMYLMIQKIKRKK